jgi:phosphoribosyl 1,2-cyclic phosphate phosphodiesterase
MMDHLQVTILGCGSSAGVPRIGGPDGSGDWGACDPANPKNRRRRCSLLVKRGATTVLVDTSPDMREQLLSARVSHLDAVLMTHPHADQTNGIDDLRPLTFIMRKRVDMYAERSTLDHLRRQFAYCFETPFGSEYPPIITGHVIPEPFAPFALMGAGGLFPCWRSGRNTARRARSDSASATLLIQVMSVTWRGYFRGT